MKQSLLTPLFWGIASILFFLLPWHLSLHPAPSASISYLCGFSNLAAQAILGLIWLVFFIRHLRSGERDPFGETLKRILKPSTGKDKKLRISAASLALVVVLVTTVWFCLLPYAYFGETWYFLQKLDLLILGQRPYVDFEYLYGPALILVPKWIFQLGRGALSPEISYLIVLEANWILGIGLFYFIFSQLNLKNRVGAFWLFSVAIINLTLGLNYTLLRFTIPLAAALAIDRMMRRTPSRRRNALIGGMAFFAPLLALSISPEFGIACAVSLFGYFAVQTLLLGGGRFAGAALLSAGTLAVPVLLFGPRYYDSCLGYSAGADFPIFPTAHVLFFFVAVLMVLPRLASGVFRWPVERRALGAALCLQFGLMVPAALGRCDSGHVLLNGLGVILIFFFAAVETVEPVWRPVIIAGCVLLFPVANEVTFLNHYTALIREVLQTREAFRKQPVPQAEAIAAEMKTLVPESFHDFHYRRLWPVSSQLTLFLKNYPRIGTPLQGGEALGKYLKTLGKFTPEYVDALVNQRQMARKLADLEKMEVIIVPKSTLGPQDPAPPELLADGNSNFLTKLFLFPVSLTAKNPPFEPEKEIARFIQSHYSLLADFGDTVMLLRNGAAPRPQTVAGKSR